MKATLLSLVQIAMGNGKSLPAKLSEEKWRGVRQLSEQHRMLAISYVGMSMLPEDQKPCKSLQIEWHMQAELIERANERRNYLCQKAFAQLTSANLHCVILKGQANCMNYPEHLRKFRHPGDLDIWVGLDRKRAVEYVKRFTTPKEGVRYNHVDFPVLLDVPIELHYRPIFLCRPRRNSNVQRWLKSEWERKPYVEYNGCTMADNRLNVIYQLLHMFRHLFEEGIVLRQVVDYVYVLKNRPADMSDADIMALVDSFGLHRFARAMMYVVRRVDPSVPVFCEPDEIEGGKIWYGIWNPCRTGKTRNDIRLLKRYPGEAVAEPFFRLWHALWRLWVR